MIKITLFKRTQISDKEAQYWANVFVAISQVLFGIAAVTFFTGGIDVNRAIVIVLNLLSSAICWMVGWRLIK